MTLTQDICVFEAGTHVLLSGLPFPQAKLVYRTYGTLSPAKDNAVLLPTWFGSTHVQNEWLIGPGRALDPARWFIVNVNLLGSGSSSSPSNTGNGLDGARFPRIHMLDNVRLQQRLLSEVFGIERLALVVGRSMGAQTAFQWGASFPERVERLFALCGSPRTSDWTRAFGNTLRSAIQADGDWNGGEYTRNPERGLLAIGNAYANWGMSAEFYLQGLHLAEASSVDDFIARRWAKNFVQRDANDLLSMIDTLQHADIAADPAFDGDFDAALAAIRCPVTVMPSRTDMIFPLVDFEAPCRRIAHAELVVLDSVWGHRAGGPNSDPREIARVDDAISSLLQRPAH